MLNDASRRSWFQMHLCMCCNIDVWCILRPFLFCSPATVCRKRSSQQTINRKQTKAIFFFSSLKIKVSCSISGISKQIHTRWILNAFPIYVYVCASFLCLFFQCSDRFRYCALFIIVISVFFLCFSLSCEWSMNTLPRKERFMPVCACMWSMTRVKRKHIAVCIRVHAHTDRSQSRQIWKRTFLVMAYIPTDRESETNIQMYVYIRYTVLFRRRKKKPFRFLFCLFRPASHFVFSLFSINRTE